MNLDFSDEQKMLQEQARSFLSKKASLQSARDALEGNKGHDQALWQEIADLGWTAITIPEAYGGLGLSHLELCIVAQELGRHLSPGPFSSSVYLATEALLTAGTHEQKAEYLPKFANGSLIGTFGINEKASTFNSIACQTQVRAHKMTGTKIMVADGDVADYAMILAKDTDDERTRSLFLVDLHQESVIKQTMATIDPGRNHSRLVFDGADVTRLGQKGDGMNLYKTIYNRAAVLFAFEQVGGSEAALDMAKSYARDRYTFGRAIGSYQAIKHKLAQMYVAITLAKSNCYYAAWALAGDEPELALASATARVSSTKAFNECAAENIQIHGGNGFTWEFDCHLFYRRAKILAMNLGGESLWKDRLVSELEACQSPNQ